MDLNSPEFYTVAFVVAMALLALIIGRTDKKPPSTHIIQLMTAAGDSDSDDTLCLEPMDGGAVNLSRTGFSLGEEETVNLVITIQEDRCSIVEKKGIKRRKAVASPMTGTATLKCLKPGTRYRMRYESQLTSAWTTFTFDTASPKPVKLTLKY